MTGLAQKIDPKTAFLNTQPDDIFITKGDLNRALFKGAHYIYGANFISDSIQIESTTEGHQVTYSISLPQAFGKPNIQLCFDDEGDVYRLKHGSIAKCSEKEVFKNDKRFIEILKCVYKHVRAEVDPKWRSKYLDVAMDSLETKLPNTISSLHTQDTGLLPTFIANDAGRIEYKSPETINDKVCNGNCKNCPVRYP